MNRYLKSVGLAVIIVLFVVVVGSFGIEKRTKKELRLAMFGGSNWDVAARDSYEVMEDIVSLFEKENPEIDIKYETGVLKDDYSEWLSEKILSDEAPDLMFIVKSDFNKFVDLDILQELDEYIKDDSEFDEKKIYASVMETGKINGKQYGLPVEAMPYLMFVNKTLLSEEGIEVPSDDYTFEDLYKICSRVTKDTDDDGIIDRFGIYKYSWRDAAAANNASVFSEDGKTCNFTSDEIKEAITFMNSLELVNNGQTVTQEDFDEGKVAFMPLTLAEYRTYKTYPYKIKKYSDFRWDCIPMPRGSAGDNKSRIDALNIAMSSRSMNKDLAWKFMKFLSSDEKVQKKIYEKTSSASVMPSIMESNMEEAILEDEENESEWLVHSEMIGSTLKNGSAEMRFDAYEGAMSLADSEINRIISNGLETDIEGSLKNLQAEISEYLKHF